MPSSTTPPPKPAAPAKKQQLISEMLTPSTTTGPSSSKSSKPKPSKAANSTLDAAMTKYLNTPNLLTVADLKTLLRFNGKSVSGNKEELLDRLLDDDDDDDDFSMDGEGNPLPPRDMSPSISHPLRIIPFDGQGVDPATLVGQRIRHFQMHLGDGFALHTDQGQVTLSFSEMPFSRYAEVMVDEALLEALKSVERVTEVLHVGDEEITRAEREKEEKKGGDLLILEAAVGMRKCADTGEYRVVGIRCEGMEKMGFMFAEDVELDDYYGPANRFGDVGVAAGSKL